MNLICPRCAVPMVEVDGYPGLHVCTADPGHGFDEDFVPPETPPPKPMGYNHLMARAAPFWLAHLGIDQPIDRVAQSNYGDGRMMMGPAAPGGGSKSKRKKPKPKAKQGPLAPYEER